VVVISVTPAIDGVRLSLHVLAAAVWVGGQFTLAGLVPTVKLLGEDAPKRVAQAFAKVSWPAYAVLLATGIWNVAATNQGQGSVWKALLGAKVGIVVLAGLAAFLHTKATSRKGLAAWGAIAALTSVSALVLGVFLAG
jgi:putative copper export protein